MSKGDPGQGISELQRKLSGAHTMRSKTEITACRFVGSATETGCESMGRAEGIRGRRAGSGCKDPGPGACLSIHRSQRKRQEGIRLVEDGVCGVGKGVWEDEQGVEKESTRETHKQRSWEKKGSGGTLGIVH